MIRAATPADAQAILELRLANREHIAPFEPDVEDPELRYRLDGVAGWASERDRSLRHRRRGRRRRHARPVRHQGHPDLERHPRLLGRPRAERTWTGDARGRRGAGDRLRGARPAPARGRYTRRQRGVAAGARAKRLHVRRPAATPPPHPRRMGRPPALGEARRRLMAIDPLHSGEQKSFFARMRVDTRPLRHRDFRNLWIGQAISTLGGAIGTVAVPYQVYSLTGSTALVGLLGLASLDPAARRAARRRRDRGRGRPPHRPPAHGDRAWRSSPLSSSPTRCSPTPQVWFALRPAGLRGRGLQPRPACDELARAAARAGRPDRGRVRARQRLQLARRRRGAGGRRRDHLVRRRAVDVRDRLRDVCRVADRDLGAAEAAAARRGRPAEPALDRRRLPLPEGPSGADRHLPRRHERDGVRDAERALPGVRAAPAGRRRVDRRLPLRGAVCRRARRLALLRLDDARAQRRGSA